jgi:hypothetical protein
LILFHAINGQLAPAAPVDVSVATAGEAVNPASPVIKLLVTAVVKTVDDDSANWSAIQQIYN